MKNYAFSLIALVICLSGCAKKDNIAPNAVTKTVFKDGGLIAFKAIPLAGDQLRMAFVSGATSLTNITLKQGDSVLATQPIAKDADGYVSATFNYAFKAGVKYNFVIQSPTATDTVYRYAIQNYMHQYVKKYNYQQVLALQQSLGPQGFDLSPSRKTLFIQDDVNNTVLTRKIDLATLNVTNVNIDFTGSPIRAVSDHELLAFGNKSTANVPAPADPGNDAVVLAKYDINTQQSSFVSFVSDGYGRISRVINNHVLVTNPVFTAKTASLIDLSDLSTVKYSLDNFDFTGIDQYSFGHFIYGARSVINPANGAISSPLQMSANAGLIEIDDATGYAFAVTSATDAQHNPLTGFNVYKNNALVYQSGNQYDRSDDFPAIYNISNNVVTFYRHFGFDTVVNLDGYYTLDLGTGQIKLIQTDSTPYIVSDFQQPDGSIFTVRSNGVYKLTVAP